MQDQLFNAGTVKITSSRTRTYASEAGMCREPGCANKARARQGARYCEEHTRTHGYNPLSGTQPSTCSCGTAYRRPHRGIGYSPWLEAWYQFCAACHRLSPLDRPQLRTHHVPFELTIKWLERRADLDCELCGRRLSRKSNVARPCIDHDHTCCPGERSCGKCIRGVLCMQCNTNIGAYESLLFRIGRLAVESYLS
jgi:hypothetical protein